LHLGVQRGCDLEAQRVHSDLSVLSNRLRVDSDLVGQGTAAWDLDLLRGR
jgi:hypothetical protein